MNAPHSLVPLLVRAADFRDPDEAKRLDAYVRSAKGGTPFHLPRWLDAVERGCGQKGFVLVAEQGPRLVGLLPLTEVHSPIVGRALVSTGFAVGGGILAEKDSTVRALADAAWDLAIRRSCPEIELRGGPVPEGWTRKEGLYASFSKQLAENDEAELAAIRKKQRAEVRKGLRNDLQVEIGTAERDRAAHYRIYAESVRNLGTPVFPRSLFNAVLDNFGEDADILTVRRNGEAVAAVLSLYFNGSVMPFWGGGTREARFLRANEVTHYSLMNHARERGCTRFDFGRSKVGSGPFHYKKNFGIEPEPLVYAGRVAAGVAAREMNPESSKYRLQVALWQKLPLAVANRLGPLIARGLG